MHGYIQTCIFDVSKGATVAPYKNLTIKKMNDLKQLQAVEKTIIKAIEQTKASNRLENCDYTQAILDNLRAALTRCIQSQDKLREELTR